MELHGEEVRRIEYHVQHVSHSVTLNEDGSITCRRVYDPTDTVEQFATDIEQTLIAAREPKIEIIEKKTQAEGPFFVLYFVVTFKLCQ